MSITNENVRAALLYALWHHQGGSSPIGQPIRLMLGLGRDEHLNKTQMAAAHFVGYALSAPPRPAEREQDEALMRRMLKTMEFIEGCNGVAVLDPIDRQELLGALRKRLEQS